DGQVEPAHLLRRERGGEHLVILEHAFLLPLFESPDTRRLHAAAERSALFWRRLVGDDHCRGSVVHDLRAKGQAPSHDEKRRDAAQPGDSRRRHQSSSFGFSVLEGIVSRRGPPRPNERYGSSVSSMLNPFSLRKRCVSLKRAAI